MTQDRDFGGYIKGLRERAGLTQVELAARAKVSVSTISQWEHRKTEPRLWSNNLRRVLKVLDNTKQGSRARKLSKQRSRQRTARLEQSDLAALQEYPIELAYLLGTAWGELSKDSKLAILEYMEYKLLRCRGGLEAIHNQIMSGSVRENSSNP
jgi:transcriptional regulator with XRE-family HTH domain